MVCGLSSSGEVALSGLHESVASPPPRAALCKAFLLCTTLRCHFFLHLDSFSRLCAPKKGIGGSGPLATAAFAQVRSFSDTCSDLCAGMSLGTLLMPLHLRCLEPCSGPAPLFNFQSQGERGLRDVSVARGHPPPPLGFHAGAALLDFLQHVLAHLATLLLPLYRSLFLCLLALLFRLLCAAWFNKPLRKRTICSSSLRDPCVGLCLPIGHSGSAHPVLPWMHIRGFRGRTRVDMRPLRHKGFCARCVSACCLAVLSAFSLPQPLPMMHFGLGLYFFTSLPSAHAMARAETPEDPLPASRRPQALGPEALTAQVVHHCPSIPWQDADRGRRAEGSLFVQTSSTQALPSPVCPSLGVYLYTPHYKTVSMLVRASLETPLRSIIDKVLDCAPGVPDGVMDRAVPLQPQRIEGCLSLIRFPSFIGAVHDGYAAVVIDLTRVHGPYYAAVLPRSLPYQELLGYVDPAAADEDPPFWVYVGCGQQPWPPQERVVLRDGDVVTVVRNGIPPPCHMLPETLASPHTWGPADRFFQLDARERSCVMYANKRYCVAAYEHTGCTLLEHAVHSLRLDLGRIAACTFHTADLDVQGNHCEWSLAVVDVPVLADTASSRARQDFFVLCDVRPLGLKPIFVHTHVPRIHVSSFLSNAGIELPPSRQLGISGGTLRRGYVSFTESCVLLFFAMEAEPFSRDSSGSDDEAAPESAAPSASSPQPDSAPLVGPDHADAPTRAFLDPTLPAGHSWNASAENTDCTDPATADADMSWRPADFALTPDECPAPTAGASVLGAVSPGGDDAPAPFAAHSGLGASDSGSYTGDSVPAPLGSASDALSAVTTELRFPVESSAVQPHEPTTLRAFVYVPDVVPEMHSVSAFLPCSVDTALAAIAAARVAEDVIRYPRLVPVCPQPFPDRILAVSAPGWLEHRPVVLLDCQRINQVIFAKALHPRLSRESLLLAAGQRHDSAWDIYVHGLLRPLLPGQVISLCHGMLVTFVPSGCGAPATSDLSIRLMSREGWEPEADVPGLGAYPGQYFWVLTDAWPVLFEVGAWRRALFDQDLAGHLQMQVDTLFTKPSHPRVIDGFFEGHLTSGLIVATQRVCRLPCPPARTRDNRLIIFIDARPVMCGFLWFLMDQVNIPVSVVTRRFMDDCPVGFGVSVSGAEIDSFGDEQFLALEDGLLLTVDYVEYLPSQNPEDSSPPPPRQDDEGHGDDSTSDAASDAPASTAGPASRNRSRSPRGVPPAPANVLACLPVVSLPWQAVALRRVVMWSTSLLHAVLAENSWSLTPVLRSVLPAWHEPVSTSCGACCVRVPFWLIQSGLSLTVANQSRLLPLANEEPSPSSSLAASSTDPLDDVDSDADTAASNGESEPTLVDVVFVLLAPDYAAEEVMLQLLLPQSVSDAFDVLDTCRGLANKQLFPTLCMVWPQPDPRWAVALMLPEWIHGEIVCCLDLARVDGRVFAVRVPRVVDSYRLLLLAGLALYAEVDIFVPLRPGPLAAGEETVLTMGDCVSFAPAGQTPESNVSLREMLGTHLPWMPGPAFPLPVETRYCLVSDQRCCDFVLLPDRAFTYRADIASRLGLPFRDLLFTPAANRVHDAAFAGRPCRTVIAVGHTEPASASSTVAICLLDCRPLLQGWFRCTARDGWLDLALLRDSLLQFAPEGWAPAFDGCQPHWQWKWVEPGDIVRVALVQRMNDCPGRFSVSGSSQACRHASVDSTMDQAAPKSSQAPQSDTAIVPFAALFPHGRPLHHQSMCKDAAFCAHRGADAWLLFAYTLLCLMLVYPVYLGRSDLLLSCVVALGCLGVDSPRGHVRPGAHRILLGVAFLSLCYLLPCGEAASTHCLAPDALSLRPFGIPAPRSGVSHSGRPRRIATPCRTNVMPPPPSRATVLQPSIVSAPPAAMDDDFVDINQPLTLLDLAVQDVDCPAFFLAATLVETLVEHFTTRHVGMVVSTIPLHMPQRANIFLDSLLPTPGKPADAADGALPLPASCSVPEFFDLDARFCALPGGEDFLDDLLRPFSFGMLRRPPDVLPRPERFQTWVEQGCVGRSPAPSDIVVVTTDGSYDPRSEAAGWAVVVSLALTSDFVLPGQFVGSFAGSIQSLRSAIGPSFGPNNAYLAEVAALFWGALLVARLPGAHHCVFRADNIGALHGVCGSMQMQPHPLCRAAFSVHTAVRVMGRPLSYQHVAGHCNDPANELADASAGAAARGPEWSPPFPIDLSVLFGQDGLALQWLPHLCYSRKVPDALPAVRDGVMSWSRAFAAPSMLPVETLRPFLRVSDGCGPPKVSSKPETVAFRLASFNALSLLDTSVSSHAAGLHGATGRVKLLCETFLAHDIALAGLQECRTFQSTMTCMGYRRFASGRDENACYGVELWVSEKGVFNAQAVTVFHTEPTLLLASLPFRGSRLCVLVAHGPHRVHSEAFRQAWWERVSCLCSAHARDAHWIVLADGNCRVGSHPSRSIGSHQADVEDLTGGLFRSLLEDLECWVPATFAVSAHGDGGTLYQKRNGELERSDYIAVPRGWVYSECAAWVEPTISAGHRCLDHFAVVVDCSVCFQDTFRARARAQRIDRHAVLDPNNFETIDQILATAPVLPWDMDASEQVAHVVDHVYRGLASAFPQQRRRMRGQQFSEDTQRLHQLVSGLRHSARTRYGAIRDTLKRCAFLAWRDRQALLHVYRGRWLWRLRIRHALDCVLLRRYGTQLRSSCKADCAACLSSMAQQIADSPCGELHRAVRKVMRPKNFRRQGSLPLPMLRTQDGTICSSQEEATRVWREHFRVLEAGVEVSPPELAASCRTRQLSFEGTDQVNVRHLPTWAHLHDAFRHASPHKAAGPDLLPPALCRVFSQRLTELFWPVMMKAVLRANEAVGLKGGVLHRIAKPNAVNNTTAGFRGILVQSCLSKVLHRAVRHLAVDHWQDHAQPMQIGGRQGCPADFGHFCSRAYLAYAKAHNRSAAILFVDISAAYYGVIREAVLGAQGQSRPVDALASSLGLSIDDLQRLQRYIDDEPVLRLQNASDVFSEVANELHRSTWFLLSGDTQLVETFRGTRPGGSLADIVFNILFSKVLDRRDRSAYHRHVPVVPWSGVRSPWQGPTEDAPSCRLTEVSDVIYADDLASFLGCDQAAELPRALSCAAAETVDTLLPHGLNANVGPTKTAAVVAPVGPGSRAVRGDIYGTRRGKITVIPESRGSFFLDLVPDYKHLGSYISHSGCLLKEIRHRLAAGRSALKEGKQRLFACRQIPFARRVSIFKTHVLSAVLSGVGTWPALNRQEATLFAGGLISMYRQLLCLRVEGGFSCTSTQILSRVGLLPPAALLHLARLRFLGQLVQNGPDPAWALLCHFSAFLQALREASDWLLAAVGSVCSLGDIVTDWTHWAQLLHDSPGRFRGILKRAEAWHLLRISLLAELETFGREHWAAAAAAPATPLEDCEHACIPCKLALPHPSTMGGTCP